ncbi:TlpA disulfide reductase family protein [uncultured Polaribacter sp.]|uniref:TlpA disulfide reductase family protein n=1 Tax=uncultured Polaribacter sp. TaxID=174711 RepID=UPI00262D769B|nr:TlpA disulfide reductase family protein [uncultured Polaribacter sp.]
MKKLPLYFLLIFLCLQSCKKESKKNENLDITSVKSYTYAELKPLLEKENNKVYVVNFWATWCAPCVKELPAFEKLGKQYANQNVEVLLVSLDFPKQVDKRLIPFIEKNKLQSKVVLLDDVNEDFWIKAIDSTWTGAIPATLIYNENKRKFYEQSFDYDLLENELKTFL